MRTTNVFPLMLLFFFALFSCSEKYQYDDDLVKIFKLKGDFSELESYSLKKIDTLNFYHFKYKKIINSEVINSSVKSEFSERGAIFYYGDFDNKIIRLFSIQDPINEVPDFVEGFMIINNNYYFKIFQNEMESQNFLYSYFKDGYVLILSVNDSNFDAVNIRKENIIKKFAIVNTNKNGKPYILNERDSKNILSSKFSIFLK